MSRKQKNWYAIYVKSRAEKKVAVELEYAGIDYYLPLIKKLKQWSDRRKWVEEPLFRSYIFVHVDNTKFYEVTKVPGVVRYVTFEREAVSIPKSQIVAIKYYLAETDPENISELDWKVGKNVEVISGSMTGLQGQLLELHGKHKVRVEIESVGGSIIISIPKSKLQII